MQVLELAADVLRRIPDLIDNELTAKLLQEDPVPLNVVLLQEVSLLFLTRNKNHEQYIEGRFQIKYCIVFDMMNAFIVYRGYLSGEARLPSSVSEYELLNTCGFIKAVSDTVIDVSDMINAVYHDKPFIFIWVMLREKLISHDRAVNRAASCLHLRHAGSKPWN